MDVKEMLEKVKENIGACLEQYLFEPKIYNPYMPVSIEKVRKVGALIWDGPDISPFCGPKEPDYLAITREMCGG